MSWVWMKWILEIEEIAESNLWLFPEEETKLRLKKKKKWFVQVNRVRFLIVQRDSDS